MAILANQKILTLDYWKPANKIQPGDYVFDQNGKPVKVKLVQEYRSENCYEVVLSDHLTIGGDLNLGFNLENKKYRDRIVEYKNLRRFRRPLKQTKVKDLLDLPLRNKINRLSYSIPTTKPLELPHQTLPVPPFLFGFWFFNRLSNGKMCTPPNMEEKIFAIFKDYGYKIHTGRRVSQTRRIFTVTPTIESQLAPFIPNKIPENYMLASAEQRFELLSGIMHSKSKRYLPKTDSFMFGTKILRDVLQVQQLAESLGHRTTLQHREKINDYRLGFKSKYKLVDNQVSPPLKVHQSRRFITNIVPIKPQSCVHIKTDGPTNSFLVGEGFIACL